MQLADTDIQEFQVLYKKHFGIEISATEAISKGTRLIRFIEIVSKYEAHKQSVQNGPQ